ncbi:putative vancomycin resistance protein, partial [Dysosmobacter welbionis]
RHGRHRPAESGGAPPVPAEPGGTPGGGEAVYRGTGQADGGTLRRHRRRPDAGGGGGPVPPLQAEAPHPGHHCPGKGPGAFGGAAVCPGAGLPGPDGGGRPVCGCRKGRGDGGGRPLRRLRHHRRDHQRRRRPPQDPPHPPGAGGKALLPGGGGGGLCLPAVLRLLPGPLPASGSPDPGRQPGGEGGLSEGPRGAGPGPGPPGRPAACDRPRQRRNGIYQVRGGGRIRPPDLPRPGAGGSLRPDGAGGRGGHRPVRPESEAPADAAPGEGQGHHGPGP